MRKNNKSKQKMNSTFSKNIVGITVSSVTSILILIVLSAIISLILLKSENIADSYIMYFFACAVISAFVGGFLSSKLCTLKGILSGLISSLVYNFILTVILLFVSKGHLIVLTGILYAISIAFFALGGIIAANTKRRK